MNTRTYYVLVALVACGLAIPLLQRGSVAVSRPTVRTYPAITFSGPSQTRMLRALPEAQHRWSLENVGQQLAPQSIVLAGRSAILWTASNELLGLDTRTGAALWKTYGYALSVGRIRDIAQIDDSTFLTLPYPHGIAARMNATDGRLLSSTHPVGESLVSSACGMRQRLLFTVTGSDEAILAFADGRLVWTMDLPWQQLRHAHPLQRQVATVSVAGTCIVALVTGGGFAVLGPAGMALHNYVDSPPIGAVRESHSSAPGLRVREASYFGAYAAPLIAGANDLLFVRSSARWIDVYRVSTGRYLYTLVSVSDVARLSASSTGLLVGGYEEGFPVLWLYGHSDLPQQ